MLYFYALILDEFEMQFDKGPLTVAGVAFGYTNYVWERDYALMWYFLSDSFYNLILLSPKKTTIFLYFLKYCNKIWDVKLKIQLF